ncbi:MAG TPA: type I-E CRISPR-associated protein Cse2/CasB [Methanofollis liminatans]|uniref:Type I-E CRISPR-associated protein Cse2/CasB n=1 Tax=Methanofollis liminatans TaxID=2201 RepID=A0A831LWI2_9EURY|nr:type I-E CRISPR-associated protein Cse2/CasB [Methanofollis liminatans]
MTMTENKVQDSGHKDEPMDAILNWWREIKAHRGERAELRRCRTPAEVAFVPAYYRLKAALPTWDREKLAVIAGVLADVETSADGVRLAAQFAHPKDGGATARVSEARFRRLLRVEDYDYVELFPMMKRLVTMIDRKANIRDLVWGLYRWDPKTKRAWAESYYMNIPKKE